MLKRGHQPQCTRGVTLLEIAVVLVVLGLVLMQVMPSVADWLQSLKLRNAAESMRAGMERARMESLKRNANVTFWMVSDANSKTPGASCVRAADSPAWVVSVSDPAGKCNVPACAFDPAEPDAVCAAPTLFARSSALENATGITVQSAANSVAFTGLGLPVPSAGLTVNLSMPGNSNVPALRVVVENGGAIRMCVPSVGATDPRACPA